MATTLTNFTAQAYALQARTDSAGAAVDDVTGEDMRLLSSLYTGGVVFDPSDSWQVRQRGAGANMSVDVGSGDADADLAVIEGTASGQGNYIVRKETGTVNVTVPAADVSNPRIDAVYLIVQDNAYDASSRVLQRIAYRDGTPAGSPSAPGPDGTWDAYLLLATISVPAGDTAITDSQITDQRLRAVPVQGAGGVLATVSDSTGQSGITGETDLTNLTLTVNVPAGRRLKITGAVPVQTVHSGSAVTLDWTVWAKEGSTYLQGDSGFRYFTGVAYSPTTYHRPIAWVTPTAGSHTYKLTLIRDSAGLSVGTLGRLAGVATLTVEDVGPA